MRCTGGLGLPLTTVLKRLSLTALLACLTCLALVVPTAFADETTASDPPAATDTGAPAPSDEAPAEPPASDPAPIAVDPVPDPVPAPDPAPAPTPDPPLVVVDPGPVVDPVVDPPAAGPLPIDTSVPTPTPVATIEVPASAVGPADGGSGDSHPSRGGSPVSVGPAPVAPSPTFAAPTPVATAPAVMPEPTIGGVIIPEPDAKAPPSWRWPAAGSPAHPGATPLIGDNFLSAAPPTMAVPGSLATAAASDAARHLGTRHELPASRIAPAPWTPSAPGAPASAGAAGASGAAGGLGGWALASFLFVLLALAAPRRVIPRTAFSPVLALRSAYAPARAPPQS